MKITIYELLGLVKDGKAPKKIRITGNIYEFDENYNFYITEDKNNGFKVVLGGLNSEINLLANAFNENVEILEEEKKIPEKLDIRQEKNIKNNWKWKVYGKEHSYNISTPQKIIVDKLNEVIDYLKSKGDE